MTTRAQVLELISKELNVEPELVANARSLRDVGIDSLGMLELEELIASYLGVEFTEEMIRQLVSFDDLVDAIEKVLAEKERSTSANFARSNVSARK